MPIYIFQNTITGEIKEIFQNMNDVHEYYGDSNEPENFWQRIFTVPNASIDTKIDPFSSEQYVRATYNKKGTYGDLLDKSKELSEKRSEINGGLDPIKEKYYEKYSKDRRGAKHPDKMKKVIENKHFKAEL